MCSIGNSHRSADPRPTTLEEDQELFVDFSSVLCLWFEIQGMRTYNFFLLSFKHCTCVYAMLSRFSPWYFSLIYHWAIYSTEACQTIFYTSNVNPLVTVTPLMLRVCYVCWTACSLLWHYLINKKNQCHFHRNFHYDNWFIKSWPYLYN